MIDLIPWLLAIIGALLGLLGFKASKTAKQSEEAQRKRAENILKAKEVREDVQTLDDDRLIAEFDRLHDNNRR